MSTVTACCYPLCVHALVTCLFQERFRSALSGFSDQMQAAKAVARQYRGVSITVFSDRDIAGRREEVEAALSGADAFFGSLLFDYDQVPCMQHHTYSPHQPTSALQHAGVGSCFL